MIVSINTVALNEEKYLPLLLSNLKEQMYDHSKIEIIFVDSMSNDNTKKIMEDFKLTNTDFYDIKILDNPLKTLAHGQNIAIQESTGDIIIKVDAHALIPRNFVLENVNTILSGEDVCGGKRTNIIESTNILSRILLLAELSMFGSGIAPYRRCEKKQYVKSLAHICVKREVFSSVGLINSKLERSEDNEFNYRLRKAGYKLCLSENISSQYQTRTTLFKMIRQKYGNGKWIGITTKISPKIFSLYHYVPFLFVSFIILSVVSFVIGNSMNLYLLQFPLIIGGSLYLIANLLLTIIAAIKFKEIMALFLLPIIFILLHFGYGIGTIIGFIEMPFINLKREGEA